MGCLRFQIQLRCLVLQNLHVSLLLPDLRLCSIDSFLVGPHLLEILHQRLGSAHVVDAKHRRAVRFLQPCKAEKMEYCPCLLVVLLRDNLLVVRELFGAKHSRKYVAILLQPQVSLKVVVRKVPPLARRPLSVLAKVFSDPVAVFVWVVASVVEGRQSSEDWIAQHRERQMRLAVAVHFPQRLQVWDMVVAPRQAPTRAMRVVARTGRAAVKIVPSPIELAQDPPKHRAQRGAAALRHVHEVAVRPILEASVRVEVVL
mmetsp:Transcript_8201/g.30810  ORF Transcript_8201/g.30810 Transcript_8201/m.30810 type:complete len:258 (-) Transcript_8201:252-1025(-)